MHAALLPWLFIAVGFANIDLDYPVARPRRPAQHCTVSRSAPPCRPYIVLDTPARFVMSGSLCVLVGVSGRAVSSRTYSRACKRSFGTLCAPVLTALHLPPSIANWGFDGLVNLLICCLCSNFQTSCTTPQSGLLLLRFLATCSQSEHVDGTHLAPVRALLRSSYAWPSALPANSQLCSITYAPRYWASDVHAVPIACMCPASCTIPHASIWHPPVCLPAWLLYHQLRCA